jgi:hypothetical protein
VRAELQQLIASLVRRCTVVSSDNVLEQRAPTPNRQ